MNREGKILIQYLNLHGSYILLGLCFYYSIASLLAKFRIDYSDLQVITDLMRKPHEETLAFYDALIKSYKPKGPTNESK